MIQVSKTYVFSKKLLRLYSQLWTRRTARALERIIENIKTIRKIDSKDLYRRLIISNKHKLPVSAVDAYKAANELRDEGGSVLKNSGLFKHIYARVVDGLQGMHYVELRADPVNVGDYLVNEDQARVEVRVCYWPQDGDFKAIEDIVEKNYAVCVGPIGLTEQSEIPVFTEPPEIVMWMYLDKLDQNKIDEFVKKAKELPKVPFAYTRDSVKFQHIRAESDPQHIQGRPGGVGFSKLIVTPDIQPKLDVLIHSGMVSKDMMPDQMLVAQYSDHGLVRALGKYLRQ